MAFCPYYGGRQQKARHVTPLCLVNGRSRCHCMAFCPYYGGRQQRARHVTPLCLVCGRARYLNTNCTNIANKAVLAHRGHYTFKFLMETKGTTRQFRFFARVWLGFKSHMVAMRSGIECTVLHLGNRSPWRC